MPPQIPAFPAVLFIALVVVLLLLVLLGLNAALKKSGADSARRNRIMMITAGSLLAWLIFIAVLAQLNVLSNFSAMPPRLIIVVLPPLIITLLLLRSKTLSQILAAIPQHALIFIQSFRILMEVILFLLFINKIIPQQMTFEGRNFDILVGASALLFGYLAYQGKLSRSLIIVWNILGLLFLFNIVSIAILSAPFPFRVFTNEPANTVIAYFPFVWLPGFVVPVAYSMHFFSIKKCLAK